MENLKMLLNSDKYQYTMGYVFEKEKMNEDEAIFNVFFRKSIDNNGFAVVSGINEVLEMIQSMGKYPYEYYKRFLPEDRYDDYCVNLSAMKFTGTVRAMKEGEIVWSNQPIITITAPLTEGQILETPILSILNHQMAVATKASRIKRATKKPFSDFSARRSHMIAGKWGAKAAYIGGADNSSNTLAKIDLGIPCTGTMAHSYIGAFGSSPEHEYEAMDAYVRHHMGGPLIMLVDTYDTLRCGVKNAIKAFKANNVDDNYGNVYGIRLDSGDLAYLSKKARRMLDDAGLKKAKIFATNGLDEYLIRDLEFQGAKIDCYGVGDALAVPERLGCVYKLVQIHDEPIIKMSEDTIKITNPGNLITLRLIDKETMEALGDVTCIIGDKSYKTLLDGTGFKLRDEANKFASTILRAGTYEAFPLQNNMIINGEVTLLGKSQSNPDLAKAFFEHSLTQFSAEHTRLTNPHVYKANISDELYDLKVSMMMKIREQIERMVD